MGAPSLFGSAVSRLPTYTARLQSVLNRLDRLIDWERRTRTSSDPKVLRFIRLSNASSEELLNRLHNPQQAFKAVHVTGSKGKGSVATLIAAALRRAPFITRPIGTYGSPHVERVNERIRFDGAEIDDELLADVFARVLDAREQHPVITGATWFDVMSVAGLLAFKEANIQWGVVEVGMGGRLDSTNVLHAPVAVVTNISLEHAEVIGPTLADIAYEKAGIIAPSAKVICGLQEHDAVAKVFLQEANSKSPPARLQFCPPQNTSSLFDHNIVLARAALRAVLECEGQNGDDAEILLSDSVAETARHALPARQESFSVRIAPDSSETIQVLLDGAHVPNSVSQVLQELDTERAPVIVLGVGREKNAAGICKAVGQVCPQRVFTTAVNTQEQYLQASELAKIASQAGLSGVTAVDDADAALEQAVACAFANGTSVTIIGSLHLAGRLRPKLRALEFTKT